MSNNHRLRRVYLVLGMVMLVVMLAACIPQPILPSAAPTEKPPTKIFTPTQTMTSIPTPTPTFTPTPTAIPEWVNTEPNNPETWPQWAQDYFKDPEGSAKSNPELHQQFYEFINKSRMDFLEKLSDQDLSATIARVINPWSEGQYLKGLTQANLSQMTPDAMRLLVKSMTPDELRWTMMGYNLNLDPDKRTDFVLSPQDIVDILQDQNAIVPYYEKDLKAWDANLKLFPWMWGISKVDGKPQAQHAYGRWQNDGNPLPYELNYQKNYIQKINIFGININFPGYPSEFYNGDIWGTFKMPGTQQMSVIGVRQIDTNGIQSLVLVGASNQSIVEDHAVVNASGVNIVDHMDPDAGRITTKATEYLQGNLMAQGPGQKDITIYKGPVDESILRKFVGGQLIAEMYAIPFQPLKDIDGKTKQMMINGVYHQGGILVLTHLSIDQY